MLLYFLLNLSWYADVFSWVLKDGDTEAERKGPTDYHVRKKNWLNRPEVPIRRNASNDCSIMLSNKPATLILMLNYIKKLTFFGEKVHYREKENKKNNLLQILDSGVILKVNLEVLRIFKCVFVNDENKLECPETSHKLRRGTSRQGKWWENKRSYKKDTKGAQTFFFSDVTSS